MGDADAATGIAVGVRGGVADIVAVDKVAALPVVDGPIGSRFESGASVQRDMHSQNSVS